jgi:hypothetical protein
MVKQDGTDRSIDPRAPKMRIARGNIDMPRRKSGTGARHLRRPSRKDSELLCKEFHESGGQVLGDDDRCAKTFGQGTKKRC